MLLPFQPVIGMIAAVQSLQINHKVNRLAAPAARKTRDFRALLHRTRSETLGFRTEAGAVHLPFIGGGNFPRAMCREGHANGMPSAVRYAAYRRDWPRFSHSDALDSQSRRNA
jgi:hypothetical protein